jgi:hypothetical protein
MRRILIVLCLVLVATSLPAQEKMRIAVLDLGAQGIDASSAAMVSDLLRTEIFNTGLFTIVERGEVDKIIAEQGLQKSGCTDQACAVEIGKLLAARKMLVGTVGKLGESFLINARIIDVELGTMEFADSARAENQTKLADAVAEFAKKLGKRIRASTDAAAAAVSAGPPRVRPYRKWGLISLGVGVAAGAFGLVEHLALLGIQDEMATLEDALDDADGAYHALETASAAEFGAAWQDVEDAHASLSSKSDEQGTPEALMITGYAASGVFLAAGAFLTFYSVPAPVAVSIAPSGVVSVSFAF